MAIDGQAVRRGRARGGQFDGRDREFIAGKRAGLVGGDQRATAKPLDRGQPSHDGAAGRHPAGGDGQRDRQRHGQALWDRRHGQHHREEKHFLRPLADRYAEQPDRRGGRDDCHRDRAGEPFHPRDQRRLAGRPCGYVDRQLTDACSWPGSDNEGRCPPAGDDRACVNHVESVGEGGLGRAGPGGILPDRQ